MEVVGYLKEKMHLFVHFPATLEPEMFMVFVPLTEYGGTDGLDEGIEEGFEEGIEEGFDDGLDDNVGLVEFFAMYYLLYIILYE